MGSNSELKLAIALILTLGSIALLLALIADRIQALLAYDRQKLDNLTRQSPVDPFSCYTPIPIAFSSLEILYAHILHQNKVTSVLGDRG